MRVISRKTLKDFWESHRDCEEQLKSWFREALNANWDTPNKIKIDYPNASILEDNRVVFNIKGNKYRLIIKANYKYRIVYIRFVGTHAEYDKIDAAKI
ncbi:MAG: type II toxin-antitoxin system HigB family toxin [Bacteroidetes bacterium]|nr:type II toxin-antitoxin system HigB family toxin [Bacteroidota bacterium]